MHTPACGCFLPLSLVPRPRLLQTSTEYPRQLILYKLFHQKQQKCNRELQYNKRLPSHEVGLCGRTAHPPVFTNAAHCLSSEALLNAPTPSSAFTPAIWRRATPVGRHERTILIWILNRQAMLMCIMRMVNYWPAPPIRTVENIQEANIKIKAQAEQCGCKKRQSYCNLAGVLPSASKMRVNPAHSSHLSHCAIELNNVMAARLALTG
jgi:hypothetical protein